LLKALGPVNIYFLLFLADSAVQVRAGRLVGAVLALFEISAVLGGPKRGPNHSFADFEAVDRTDAQPGFARPLISYVGRVADLKLSVKRLLLNAHFYNLPVLAQVLFTG
jgi:hypothetical protein